MTNLEELKALAEKATLTDDDKAVLAVLWGRHGTAILSAVPVAPDEDWLEEVISDSLDMDWRPRDAAKAIIARWSESQALASLEPKP